MRIDREAQGKQRGPGKDTGPWGGEFLRYFGKTGDPRKDKDPGVGNSYAILRRRGALGKTRTLGWGIPMQFLGIVEKMI